MLGTQFPDWPNFTAEEIAAVSNVLASNKVNYWTGQECRLFESEFAAWCETSHAIALANGTLALDLCWKILGIGPGDEVICTPRTFVASAFSIINAGATPVFCDVDLNSQIITPEVAATLITPHTKAILCVHLAGWPSDMDGFRKLADAHNLKLVEDCAQAHGAKWNGKPVGSQSDMAAWSFCQDKIMTTGGEGGMVTMNDEELWSKAWSFKDHGKSWDAVYNRKHPSGFRWLHETVGTNWRMLEMQAAIGRIQLRNLKDWTTRRTQNAHTIFEAARSWSCFRVPPISAAETHAFYKAYIFTESQCLKDGWDRDRIIAEISAEGVPCFQGSCSEIYLEKAFNESNGKPVVRLPNAQKLGDTSMMFLVHPTLRQEDLEKTCAAIHKVSKAAQR